MDPVAKYRSADPEGLSIDWERDGGTDADGLHPTAAGCSEFKRPAGLRELDGPGAGRHRPLRSTTIDGNDDPGESASDADANMYRTYDHNDTVHREERHGHTPDVAKSSMVGRHRQSSTECGRAGDGDPGRRLLPEADDASDTVQKTEITATLTDADRGRQSSRSYLGVVHLHGHQTPITTKCRQPLEN